MKGVDLEAVATLSRLSCHSGSARFDRAFAGLSVEMPVDANGEVANVSGTSTNDRCLKPVHDFEKPQLLVRESPTGPIAHNCHQYSLHFLAGGFCEDGAKRITYLSRSIADGRVTEHGAERKTQSLLLAHAGKANVDQCFVAALVVIRIRVLEIEGHQDFGHDRMIRLSTESSTVFRAAPVASLALALGGAHHEYLDLPPFILFEVSWLEMATVERFSERERNEPRRWRMECTCPSSRYRHNSPPKGCFLPSRPQLMRSLAMPILVIVSLGSPTQAESLQQLLEGAAAVLGPRGSVEVTALGAFERESRGKSEVVCAAVVDGETPRPNTEPKTVAHDFEAVLRSMVSAGALHGCEVRVFARRSADGAASPCRADRTEHDTILA